MRYADARCTYTESFDKDAGQTYTFTGNCIVTGKPHSVTVPAAGLFAYRQGASIQSAFPGLSAEDREFLISGTSPEGWREMFGDPDGDDDDSEES